MWAYIQEQLVMLFFYNDAASYELSVWRVSSCGHVQEQLVMPPLYNDAASYVCRRNETARCRSSLCCCPARCGQLRVP